MSDSTVHMKPTTYRGSVHTFLLVVMAVVLGVGCAATTSGASASPSSHHHAANGAAAGASNVPLPRLAWKQFLTGDFSTSAIFLTDRAGQIHQVTHPTPVTEDDLPDWSPDGSNVIFMRIHDDTNTPSARDQLMRVRADGTHLATVGSCRGDCFGNDDPAYSPSGRQIAYTKPIGAAPPNGTNAPTQVGVWVMRRDGTGQRKVTQLPGTDDHQPAWAPSEKRLLFTRINDTESPVGAQALYTIRLDRSHLRRITPWWLGAGGGSWSPDGRWIVFQSYRDCCHPHTSQIWIVHPDGSGLHQLTHQGRNIEPDWSPSGHQIVYAHQPGTGANGFPDLYTMTSNGTSQHLVFANTAWDSEPAWGPRR